MEFYIWNQPNSGAWVSDI